MWHAGRPALPLDASRRRVEHAVALTRATRVLLHGGRDEPPRMRSAAVCETWRPVVRVRRERIHGREEAERVHFAFTYTLYMYGYNNKM